MSADVRSDAVTYLLYLCSLVAKPFELFRRTHQESTRVPGYYPDGIRYIVGAYNGSANKLVRSAGQCSI